MAPLVNAWAPRWKNAGTGLISIERLASKAKKTGQNVLKLIALLFFITNARRFDLVNLARTSMSSVRTVQLQDPLIYSFRAVLPRS
jgi:hypothetical protein